jgi:uncharacterized membrane protein
MWAPEWYHASAKNFDAEAIAQSLRTSNADVGFTFQGFTQDIFGKYFFPSDFGPTHSNLQEGRNYMAEYVEAMHKRNLKVFGYIFYPDKQVWEENPDWRQKDINGNEIIPKRWGVPCPNSPYRELFINRIEEIIAKFDVDGFLLDTVTFSPSPLGCFCDYCRRKYLERYGKDLPKEAAGFTQDMRRFLRWRDENLAEFHSDVRKAIKKIKPECVYTHNAFAFRGIQVLNGEWKRVGSGGEEDLELTLPHDDIVTSIISWRRALDTIWEVGSLTKIMRGLGDKPVWIQFGHFPYHRDYQTLPIHELKMAVYSTIINGGSPFFIGNVYPDGNLLEISMEKMGTVYEEVASIAEHLDYDEEVKFAAIYFSKESLDYYDMIYPGKLHYLSAVKGCMKALVEAKMPFRIIGEKSLDAKQLSQYSVIIIPDAVVMTDKQINVLKEYVDNGGTLICTGKTSLMNPNGVARDNFGLSDVFHTNYINTINYQVSFIIPTDHAVCNDIDTREQIPVRGLQIKNECFQDTDIIAYIALPNSEIVHGVRLIAFDEADVAAEKTTEYPAAVASRYGKGRCVYFSGDITGVYGSYGYPSLRKLLLNAIDYCCGDRKPLTVRAPLNVEINCFKKDGNTLIHFLNYTTNHLRVFIGHGGPQSEEGIPCRDIEVEYRLNGGKPQRVYLVSAKKEIQFNVDGDMIRFTVPKVDVHEIALIEMK